MDSTNDLAVYKQDGFVVPKFRLPAADLAKLQTMTMDLVKRYPDRNDKAFPSLHVNYDGGRVQVRWPNTEEWLAIASHPGILNVVETLIGQDLILFATALFYKRAQNGPATPWHRDGPFPISPVVTTTVWLAVFDSKIDNGCLRAIPRSHLSQEWGRHYQSTRSDVNFPLTLAEDEYDESTARDIELNAGQMVLFDGRIIHGARHNIGVRHRAGFTIRFMPSTSHYKHDIANVDDRERDFASRPLFLVRGVDRCGLNDFKRHHIQRL